MAAILQWEDIQDDDMRNVAVNYYNKWLHNNPTATHDDKFDNRQDIIRIALIEPPTITTKDIL